MPTSVLLTGASGYIALHITDFLLKDNFKVVGTVRTESMAEQLTNQFKKLYPQSQLTYEVVPDISTSDAFDEALKNNEDITKILHTTSPFAFGMDMPFEEAYLTPSIEGTKNILISATKFAPQVDHVVVTSSFAAIMNRDKFRDKSFIHTEETWNPIEWDQVKTEDDAYLASKKLAETAAWEYVKKVHPNYGLTTIAPPYVFGVQFFKSSLGKAKLNASAAIITKLLATPPEAQVFISEPRGLAVDVRDLAWLHVKVIQDGTLGGERLLPASSPWCAQLILNIIHKNFPELDESVGTGDNSEASAAKFVEELTPAFDCSKTLKLVGRDHWVSLDDSIVATVKQILEYKRAHVS